MSVNLHCTMYCRLSEQLSKSIKVGMEDKTAPHTESTNYLSVSTNGKQEPICVDQSEFVIRLPQQPMRSAHQIMAKQRKSSKQTCQGYRKIFLYATNNMVERSKQEQLCSQKCWVCTKKNLYRNSKAEPSVICQYVCQSFLFVQPIRS